MPFFHAHETFPFFFLAHKSENYSQKLKQAGLNFDCTILSIYVQFYFSFAFRFLSLSEVLAPNAWFEVCERKKVKMLKK